MVNMVPHEAFACRCAEGDVVLRQSYKPESYVRISTRAETSIWLDKDTPNFDGTYTYRGYSDHMVYEERFVLRWPDNLPLDSSAPLLYAGITS
ncbi:mannitol dehydrogenase-like protein [Tanacetum coccineum]|uniref:Mannitol dehydrogenase-like protein n=1 Tax=Tanacetum coccineum TaxID=301880 RepID=A0ABQ5G9P6_9ASTR